MTREKLMALCKTIRGNKGFRADLDTERHREQMQHVVILNPGVGFPSSWKIIYRTSDKARAEREASRLNTWLKDAGMLYEPIKGIG